MLIIGVSLMIVLIGLYVAKSISKPIISAVDSVQKIASGNLTEVIVINQHDELGSITTSLARYEH